jgi:uncharacterized repeat protein (TIGR03803 family)
MQRSSALSLGRLCLVAVVLGVAALAPSLSRAADLTTLVSFCAQVDCADGGFPAGTLIADADGNLFGTTEGGGANGGGTVFEIARTATGYASTPIVLYSFCAQANCTDGARPLAGLIADAKGNLFGTTFSGGANNNGTVFEIGKIGSGYSPIPDILVSFCEEPSCADGAGPAGGVIADAEGNLFGTTESGGANNGGTVFEIAKTGTAYASVPTILYSFCSQTNCNDGAVPVAGLILDAEGNLLGTTSLGPNANSLSTPIRGTVFEIAKTRGGYASVPTILYQFCSQPNCTDGAGPRAPLTTDADGNLFGTTFGDRAPSTIFEIVKTGSGYASEATILYRFCDFCTEKAPLGGLLVDAVGNLFGTTCGYRCDFAGTVFELRKTDSGYAATADFLYRFCGGAEGATPSPCADGAHPLAGVTADATGNLFGTTSSGGAQNEGGTVFEITDSGFVSFFAGTPGKPNCHGKTLSDLTQRFGGLGAAAAALHYTGVDALRDAIEDFCKG